MRVTGTRALLCAGAVLLGAVPAWAEPLPADRPPLPEAAPDHLPRWRGFNLLNKFHKDWNNGPYLEEDFRWIAELGFNFVRLPMDYRCWVEGGDGTHFNESVLGEVDQAVAWGRQYGIHVCLNLHRAPGFTVAKPPETLNLWRDPDAQRACVLHWERLARRYAGIPSRQLSFNLLNEPHGVDSQTYARVVGVLARAIRKVDPDRLIIADGLETATLPCAALAPLRVAQATRGYGPGGISHYRASWVDSSGYPPPAWPQMVPAGYLYSPSVSNFHRPMTLVGPFPTAATLRLKVGQVSGRAELVVRADGEPVYRQVFESTADPASCKQVIFKPEWKVYQNRFDTNILACIPAGTERLEVVNTNGDWLTVEELAVIRGNPGNSSEFVLAIHPRWGQLQEPMRYLASDAEVPFRTVECRDRAWLHEQYVAPWVALREQGTGVMVGEWGAHNQTPHPVVLRWMEDCLANWKAADMGWALWNFRGSFGILDSGRRDVRYEDFHGHKLDRAMLDLLQRY